MPKIARLRRFLGYFTLIFPMFRQCSVIFNFEYNWFHLIYYVILIIAQMKVFLTFNNKNDFSRNI